MTSSDSTLVATDPDPCNCDDAALKTVWNHRLEFVIREAPLLSATIPLSCYAMVKPPQNDIAVAVDMVCCMPDLVTTWQCLRRRYKYIPHLAQNTMVGLLFKSYYCATMKTIVLNINGRLLVCV